MEQFIIWIDQYSGVLTLLTALGTFFTCVCSYLSARATQKQVEEMQRQYEESNRPNIQVEFIFEKHKYCGLRFVNHGTQTAQNVKIEFDSAFTDNLTELPFADMIRKQKDKKCIIGVGQHFDLYFGTMAFRENPDISIAKGTVFYSWDSQEDICEFCVDLKNYATIFSTNSTEEDLFDKLKAQTEELEGIKRELEKINTKFDKTIQCDLK
ncbi:hypothetical protein [Massilistercora timonensis]|uniref:hypothetical protein n=1 Tax=Massilistercora timonensis TaxID=2086584 RepID=UPI003209F6D1